MHVTTFHQKGPISLFSMIKKIQVQEYNKQNYHIDKYFFGKNLFKSYKYVLLFSSSPRNPKMKKKIKKMDAILNRLCISFAKFLQIINFNHPNYYFCKNCDGQRKQWWDEFPTFKNFVCPFRNNLFRVRWPYGFSFDFWCTCWYYTPTKWLELSFRIWYNQFYNHNK